jgi:hypothetical protein
MLSQKQTWCHQTANNKWANQQAANGNQPMLHLSKLGFAVIDNKWASTHV